MPAALFNLHSAICRATPAAPRRCYQTDLDFNKRFNLPVEGMQLEFRSELYNIFNHTNLYLPGRTVSGTQAARPVTPAAVA